MEALQAKLDMVLGLLRETREDVKEIKADYAKRSDLKDCRAHCNGVTADVYGQLHDHRARLDFADAARLDRRQEQDLEAQKGMRTNIIVAALISALAVAAASILGHVMGKIWP